MVCLPCQLEWLKTLRCWAREDRGANTYRTTSKAGPALETVVGRTTVDMETKEIIEDVDVRGHGGREVLHVLETVRVDAMTVTDGYSEEILMQLC